MILDALCTIGFIVHVVASTQLPIEYFDETSQHHLTLSAIVHDADPPHPARIECWELSEPFTTYPTVGYSFALANTTNLTYVSLPPRSAEGKHHPPHPMLFILIAGQAHVTLPDDLENEGLWIVEGVNPVIVAVDTLGEGHFTDYPGDKETVALQAPFRDGKVPGHKVVHQGACSDSRKPDGVSRASPILSHTPSV